MILAVVGFIMMLSGFSNVDTNSGDKIQVLLASMGGGMATALYTTLVGLVCCQAMKVQYFNLTQGLNKAMEQLPQTDSGPVNVEAQLELQKKLEAAQKKFEAAKQELMSLDLTFNK